MKALLACLLLCATVPAQRSGAQHPTDEQQEAARARRALQNNRAEVDRLLELRMRHDLGLPTEDTDRTFVGDVDATPFAMEQMRRTLREEDAQTSSLQRRFEELRKAVAELRSEAQQSIAAAPSMQPVVVMPTAGSTLPPSTSFSDVAAPRPEQVPAAPGVEVAPKRRDDADLGDLALDPLRAQIHGSKDHQRVAEALFKAGQALMDRGELVRARGDVARGKELDDRGRERLVRAVEELESLVSQDQPPYVSLFYLGRCRELLFRYSERHEGLDLEKSPREYQRREQEVREPFLAISARDVTRTGERGEHEVLGSWGQAAKTAMEHFRWMNLHASYDAATRIGALTWPGEEAQ